jgi:uncharacterized protein (UPF0303 family)
MSTPEAARIAEIEQQERELVFPAFAEDDARLLGEAAVAEIAARGITLAVDVVLGETLVFRASLGGGMARADHWLPRKGAVTRLTGESSLLVRYRNDAAGTSFADRTDVDHADFAAYGGAFPIVVTGSGLVGTITTSGAEDTVDHEVAVAAVRRFLGR